MRARVEAFDETPEGRGRRRIRELDDLISLSIAEQNELDSLQTLYPALPPDQEEFLRNEGKKELKAAIKQAHDRLDQIPNRRARD